MWFPYSLDLNLLRACNVLGMVKKETDQQPPKYVEKDLVEKLHSKKELNSPPLLSIKVFDDPSEQLNR